VSIITPCHNSERYVGETIESVQAQTYPWWEMIIVDDCSTDGSTSVVESYAAADPRIRLVRLPENVGPALARNRGVELAAGQYITYIDSDDLWYPRFLEKTVRTIRATGYPFVYASYARYLEEQKRYLRPYHVPRRVDYQRLLKNCPIPTLTAVYDAKVVGKHYMLDVGREDYSLWFSLLDKTPFAYGLKEPLAVYRMHKASRSRNKLQIAKLQWTYYRDVLSLSFARAARYMVYYAMFSLRKYLS